MLLSVLNYCVAFPIPFCRNDPNNELYKWFLMHYDCKLEMVNNTIVYHVKHLNTGKCQKSLISYECVKTLRINFLPADHFQSKWHLWVISDASTNNWIWDVQTQWSMEIGSQIYGHKLWRVQGKLEIIEWKKIIVSVCYIFHKNCRYENFRIFG